MNIWIDCEWNSYRGALLSLALVAEDGEEFYRVLPCQNPDPWVIENVLPVLGNVPLTDLLTLQEDLELWLSKYPTVTMISDWPEDVSYFCAALITGPGKRIQCPPLTFVVDFDLRGRSVIPHNALEDARANRLDWLTGKRS